MQVEEIRSTDEFNEIFWIATELGQRLPQLRDNPIYHASIPRYLANGAYKFIIAGPRTVSGEPRSPTAFGFVTFYRLPMAERLVLVVEGFWFKDDRLDHQLPVWSFIASLARRMDFHGVCITERSVNTPNTLRELLARGELDGDPVGRATILLQADVHEIYSAFTEGPLPQSAFSASCARIFTLREPVNFAGSLKVDDSLLYRGEGWLTNVNELAAFFIERGFSPRAEAGFNGTVQEQILHQGYVDQATISLTTSFKVATHYATRGKKQEQGLVFTVDGQRLRKYGEIFDAYATMANHCDWLGDGEFKTIHEIVKILGVLKAGRFLERCNEEARSVVARGFGGARSLAGPINWTTYVPETDDWNRLRKSVGEHALNSLHDAFEYFWIYASGEVGAVDKISLQEGHPERVETKLVGPFGYYIAFREVEDLLKGAHEKQKKQGRPREPGWDLTPFGYIAKTCIDEECFSSGRIPADCVIEATLVNRTGDPIRVLEIQ